MQPIKVNYKKIDGTKTSTTLCNSVCKTYASVFFDVKLSDFNNVEDYASQIAKLAQAFVNAKNKTVNKCDLELHKDFIEDMMLHECIKKIKNDNIRA